MQGSDTEACEGAVTRRSTPLAGLAADAAGAEWACVGADFFEGAGEGFGVCVGEVLGEVAIDAVAVVAASVLHRLGALVGDGDEDRAAIVGWTDAADEPGLLHTVDDAGEAALL